MSKMSPPAGRLGYLSAAPRVSTRATAEAAGPRAHILGIIKGFQASGWQVFPYIAGDVLPESWSSKGSERQVSGNLVKTLAADIIRLGMSSVNNRRAWQALGGKVDWVYERAALLQVLGKQFQKQGIPWILECNAIMHEEASQDRKSLVLRRLARRIEFNAYQACDALVCVSEPLKQRISEEAAVPGNKIIVVPNGVDLDLFDPHRNLPMRLFEGFTIGFVGTLYGWQGLDLLLEAVATLKDRGGPILHVAIIGDGMMRGPWEELMHHLGLRQQVSFIGRVPSDAVPGYIMGFDLGYSCKLVPPGEAAHFSPLKLYEYMAMARPVLASDDFGSSQLVKHGETGFLFPAGDLNALVDTLRECHSRKNSLRKMGKAARGEIVAHHSWASRVQMMTAEVRRVLDG